MKNREIANNNSAMVQRADFISPPSMALPIWAAISVVRVFVVEKMLVGSAVVCPMTMATARASPKALARPKITPEMIPGAAAGTTIRYMVCQRVEPSPYAAILHSFGTE